MKSVVLDSNVFVAAGFNPRSSSAALLARVRAGDLRLVWQAQTREETKIQLQKIPPLAWAPFADLFRDEDQFTGALESGAYDFIADVDDRKFAALADATNAVLVTNDRHLLSVAGRLVVPVLTPRQAERHDF